MLKGHPHVAGVPRGGARGPRRRHRRGAEGIDAFPDSFVEEVRRTADIVRYISEHVQLRKMGDLLEGPVPVPQEKTPSFNVRRSRARLPLLRLRRGRRRVQVRDAPRARRLPGGDRDRGPPLRHPGPGEPRTSRRPTARSATQLLALLEAAAEHFTRNLWAAPGTRAREYLLGPRLQEGDAREDPRRRRAATPGRDLLRRARAQLPEPPLLMTAGLVVRRPGRQAALRPLPQPRGLPDPERRRASVVAFGARSLDGSEPKYLNSPESPVYQKSRTLYGLSWAKDAHPRGGPRRTDGGLPRRGARPRGRRRRGGGHLRHRADRRRTRACCGASPSAWW